MRKAVTQFERRLFLGGRSCAHPPDRKQRALKPGCYRKPRPVLPRWLGFGRKSS